MPIRLPAVGTTRVLFSVGVALQCILALPSAGQISGKPVTLEPGYRLEPKIIDAFGGCSVVAWRGGRIYASLLDSTGREAPGWPVNGVGVSQLGFSPLKTILVKLSDDAVGFVWTNRFSGSHDGYVGWLRRSTGGLPTPIEIATDTVTARAGDQGVYAAIRQDDTHAVVLVSGAELTNSAYALIKQVGLPGAASTGWPAGGIKLVDTIGVTPLRACTDDSLGVFVLTGHQHNCVPVPHVPCPVDLKLFHFFPDGSLDPAWPAAGVLVTDSPGWDQEGLITPDHAGGVYIAWYDARRDSLRVRVQHLGRDGTPVPGWQPEGNSYPSFVDYPYLRLPAIATTSTGDLIILVEKWISVPWLVAVRADGSLVPGWPDAGLRVPIVGDGSYWESGEYCLGLTSDDRIVVVGDHFLPASTEQQDIWGVAFNPDGTVVSGWQPTGQALCSVSGAQSVPAMSMCADASFKVAWLDQRIVPPETTAWPYVYFDHFAVTDGAVPTLATARIVEHAVDGRRLWAAWRVFGAFHPSVVALRAVDKSEFAPSGVLEPTGQDEVHLRDTLPESFGTVWYVLADTADSALHVVSDTLVIRAASRAAFAIHCPSPQRGDRVVLEMEVGGRSGRMSIGVFDVTGRRTCGTTLVRESPGRYAVSLDMGSAPPGLYFVKASNEHAERAVARMILLR